MISATISTISFLFLPFLGTGILRKIRALLQRRRGPRLLQPCYDLYRTIRKSPVDGPFSGEFALISPIMSLLSGVTIWALVVFQWASALWIVPLLAVQVISLTTFACETGTSFGGLGASREILITSLAKPTLIVVLLFFETANHKTLNTPLGCFLAILFCLITFVAILAETARPPFDDPRTHLELTMVHEAMLLEASGTRLAFFEMGAMFKMAGLLMLLSRFLVASITPLFDIRNSFSEYVIAILLFAAVGIWESSSVRRKWTWVPETLGLTFLTAVLLMGLMTLSRL
jgi:formate hydrogenlyase subunit 4